MPTHVYANNNEVASKAADGKSIAAFPDVCFSPPAPPVGPMPLPYPNTGEVKDTDSGTAKVFVKDKMSGMGDDSYMTKSMGNEPATQNFNKGIISSALQGKCYFGLWSMDVNMEGKGVPRHLDMVTHNHASKPGQSIGFDKDATLTVSSVSRDLNDNNNIYVVRVFAVHLGVGKICSIPCEISYDSKVIRIIGRMDVENDTYCFEIIIDDVDFDNATAKFSKAEYKFTVSNKLCVEQVKISSFRLVYMFRNNRTIEVYIPVSFNSYKEVDDLSGGISFAQQKQDTDDSKLYQINLLKEDGKEGESLLTRVKKLSADSILDIFKEKMIAKGVKNVESYCNTKACLVGIRAKHNKYNEFDDVMCLVYKENEKFVKYDYTITTEPGIQPESSSEKRISVIDKGCFRYYFGIHKISKINNTRKDLPGRIAEFTKKAYPALIEGELSMPGMCDITPKNNTLTANVRPEDTEDGSSISGINIHCACYNPAENTTAVAPFVSNWSAGCQVFKRAAEFNAFFEICKKKNIPSDCQRHCIDKQFVINRYVESINKDPKKPVLLRCDHTSKSCSIYYVLVGEEDIFKTTVSSVGSKQFYI